MFTHHVLFWLKSDITATQKEAFLKGLQSLEGIETIQQMFIGTPAPIDRNVVDKSYTFSLLVLFEDIEAHNIYQTHAIHLAFLSQFKVFFEKVVIYDAA